ncbi:uncharacterized protein L3040_005589 [Drepanopeziza brunnea f. sp. 'multigermtubi']|uniref:uncharacterized protein n=1 Tax=Drepanopeziza brunnea f. sp. 'multigermtubi' TaxID=698441 RepID=UPI0023996BE6|nr:hypothetical protein L3040_005589 [Drepanopeziza brunnea f. sp. 'multigermtubi']
MTYSAALFSHTVSSPSDGVEWQTCPDCAGGRTRDSCEKCNGSGVIGIATGDTMFSTPLAAIRSWTTCADCRVAGTYCVTCNDICVVVGTADGRSQAHALAISLSMLPSDDFGSWQLCSTA